MNDILQRMNTKYLVQEKNFSGPLEILLERVERKKLHINEVSLAQVTDDFIEYLQSHHKEIPKGLVATFISIASILLYIKSQSLVPGEKDTELEDQANELEYRLKYLALFNSARKHIYKMMVGPAQSGLVQVGWGIQDRVFNPGNIDVDTLYKSLNTYLQKEINDVFGIRDRIAVKQKINSEKLIASIKNILKKDHNDKDFLSGMRTLVMMYNNHSERKMVTALGFLTALELAHRGDFDLEQDNDSFLLKGKRTE